MELGIRGLNADKKIFALFVAKGVDIVSDVCYGYAIMEIWVLRRLAVPAFFCGAREVCGGWRCRLFLCLLLPGRGGLPGCDEEGSVKLR